MAKNDNSTTYGISTLTPTNSVNISQSDITYNPITPIWTNGILNRIENLQGLISDSSLFSDYNILEKNSINDISIDSSIFDDVVDDSSVGAEQVLSTPIEMCTLYEVVDKVLPFAPYVYKNYGAPLMTDDESTYCPTYSQINRSTELTVMLYKDDTYRNGRIFRFDGDKMSMPQLTMKKSGAKMNYANKNLVNIDDVDVVRKSYRIIVKTHNFSYKNDNNLKNGISMFINGCTLRTDLTSNSEGNGVYVFETNPEAMPFEDMYLQCRYSYNDEDLFNENIDMFYVNITDGNIAYVADNFSYTISNKKMARRELFLFIGAKVDDYYKSYEKIQIGKLLKGSDGDLPLNSQTIEDDVYIDIYARIKDRAIVGIGTDGYVNINEGTSQSGGDMIIESPAYSIVYHTLYQNNAKLNLLIESSDLAHRPYISYKFKNARTQQVIKDIEKINLSEIKNNIFSLEESVDPTDKYYLWVNTIEATVKKTITLKFYGSYFTSQNALSVLTVTFNKVDVKGASTQDNVFYEYITKDDDDQLGCEVVFTISKNIKDVNNNVVENKLFADIDSGVILGWFYFNNQNISSPNLSFNASTNAYTASHLFPLFDGAEYKIYFTKKPEIKLSLQRNVKELLLLDENGYNVFDDITTPLSKKITLNNRFFKYTITYNDPSKVYNHLSYTIVRYPNDNPELKTTISDYKDLPTIKDGATKEYNLEMRNLLDGHTYMINFDLSRGYQEKTLTVKIDNSNAGAEFDINAVGVRLENKGITPTSVSTDGSTATYDIESGTAILITFNLGNDFSLYESVTASGSCTYSDSSITTPLTFNATVDGQSYVFDTVLTNDSTAVDITLTPTKKTLYGFIIAQTNERSVLDGGSVQSKICNVVEVYYYNEDESKYKLILNDNTYEKDYTLNTNYGVDRIKLKLVSQDRTVYPSFKYELYVINSSLKKEVLEFLEDWTAYEENGNEIEFTNLKGKYPAFSNFRIDITSKYVGVPIIFGLQGLDVYTMKIYDKTIPNNSSNSLIIGTESGEYDEESESVLYKKYITTDGFRNTIRLSFQYGNEANGYNYILYGNADVNATYSSSGWAEIDSEDDISSDSLNITSLKQTSTTKSYKILFTPVYINKQDIMFIGCGKDPNNFDNIIPASKDTYWYAKVTSKDILTPPDIVLLNYADEGYEGQNIKWSTGIKWDSIVYSSMSGGGYENLIKFHNLKNYSDIVWSTPNGTSIIYTNQSVEKNTDAKTLHMVRFNDVYGGKSCMLQGNIGRVLKLSVDESNLTWSYGQSGEAAQKIVHFGIFEYKKNTTSEWPAQEEHEVFADDINDITFTSSVWDIKELNLDFTKLTSAVDGRWYKLVIKPSIFITLSTNNYSVLYIHYLDYKVGINMSHLVPKTINYRFMYSKSAVVSSTNTSDLMVKGDKYIWVEDGNNISGVSKDIPEGINFNTAFGTGLSDNDLYSKNTNYYTPGGSTGNIYSTISPRAYTYNGTNLMGKSMEYGKTYYLWYKRAALNTWQKSQFYIVFKDKDWASLNSSTLTFIIKNEANVIPWAGADATLPL